ncbi:4a-hydroxytetrahydrobiopterin dehydratase [Glutamicibacter sp. NPDC087673]|uniref:4a-hydroxytetrahydrobiopterin dehydratase n=1 Tax=Glutamicibacter sp. NPDC087673 TaxID=3363997 RepID=UPI00381B4613
MTVNDRIESTELASRLEALPQWRKLAGKLCTVYEAKSSAEAIELFSDIAAAAQMANHHPDVDWRYNLLFVSTVSHDAGGDITERDLALASEISQRAAALHAKARLDLIKMVEIGIDTDDAQAISGQWAAGLGYREQADGSLADPAGRLPGIWFQETPDPNPNRLHLDVWVPFSESEPVLEALGSESAGLDAQYAPSFTVATDRQGNRFCICTERDR